MGLAEFQGALAHLYTDAGARAELRADPAGFAVRHGLSAEEASVLAKDVIEEAQDFAAALARKRRDEAARAMPLADEALGPRFAPAFREFAAGHPLGAMRNPALDAQAFLEWLLARRDPTLSPQERAALRYAHSCLAMQNSTRRGRIRLLRLPEAGLALALWWRWGGRLHHRLIGWPAAARPAPAML